MSNKLDISVIVRAGKVDAWLRKCIDSILASADINLEIVLVLNSKFIPANKTEQQKILRDNSWLAKENIKVLWFDRPLGVSNAMRAGVAAAQAELIANVDADDYVTKDKFIKQLRYLRNNPDCALVGSGGYLINDSGETIGALPQIENSSNVTNTLFLYNPLPHSSVLMRKDTYIKAGGYRENLEQFEDFDLFLRLAAHGKLAILPEPHIFYRVHNTNTSKKAKPWGQHIAVIGAERRKLNGALHGSTFINCIKHAVWCAAQFARYFGLTKPMHEYSAKK